MKKLLALLVFLLVSFPLFAQQWIEVLYLNNGSIIRGTIIEQIPGESLKIQTSDGSVFVYSMNEVLKITKEQITPNQTTFNSESKSTFLNGPLSWDFGEGLKINGEFVDKDTAIGLLGEEKYEQFKTTFSYYGTGASITFYSLVIGTLLTGYGGLVVAFPNREKDVAAQRTVGLLVLGLGMVFDGVGIGAIITQNKLRKELDSIVEEYNQNNGYAVRWLKPIPPIVKEPSNLMLPDYTQLFAFTIPF